MYTRTRLKKVQPNYFHSFRSYAELPLSAQEKGEKLPLGRPPVLAPSSCKCQSLFLQAHLSLAPGYLLLSPITVLSSSELPTVPFSPRPLQKGPVSAPDVRLQRELLHSCEFSLCCDFPASFCILITLSTFFPTSSLLGPVNLESWRGHFPSPPMMSCATHWSYSSEGHRKTSQDLDSKVGWTIK